MATIPEISKKWWGDEKPNDIKGDDLTKSLAACEKAIADAEKKGDESSIDAGLAALKALGSAADKTIKKECDKKKHKELIAVLAKFDNVIAGEVQRLNAAKAALAEAADKDEDDDDEDDSKGKLFQPDYLVKMIKLLKTGKELKFSFGLDKSSPENSCLLLCRKREPERLFKMLRSKTEFSKRLMTYGHAKAEGKVLQFLLSDNAKEPSQICKLVKVYLKKNPELKFKKLKVVCGGQTFEEDMEGEGQGEPQVAGGAGAGDLQQRLKKAAAAAQTWKQTRESLEDQISQLRAKLDAFNDPDVKTVRDRLGSMLERYPTLDFSALASAADQPAFDRALEQTRRGIAEWKTALAQDKALSAIDKNPFINTNVILTVGNALGQIDSELNQA